MTHHRSISRRSVFLGHNLASGSLSFSTISTCILNLVAAIGSLQLVHNRVPLATYPYSNDPGRKAPLVFLSRVEAGNYTPRARLRAAKS